MSNPYIHMEGIVKAFPPAVLALDNVDISIRKDEIHSIIGENGAGKSTLMNILYGLHIPNDGSILINGTPVTIRNPGEAVKHGIGMVHQEFMLIPSYTVYENVILGSEPVTRIGTIDYHTAKNHIAQIIKEFKLNLDPDARVEALSVAAQQKIEILKLLYRDVSLLIMDEPTAVLAPQEIEELFRRLKALRERGKTIVFISHKLDEVLHLSDTITIMRAGKHIRTIPNSQGLSRADLAKAMVGRSVVFSVSKSVAAPKEEVLRVDDITLEGTPQLRSLRQISFSVKSGEIVGIAGVEGNGQFELVKIVTGSLAPTSGKLYLHDQDITEKTISERRQILAYITQDRKGSGSSQDSSLVENAIMTHHKKKKGNRINGWRPWLISNLRAKRHTDRIIEDFNVLALNDSVPMSTLSGGNQQKVIIGREFTLDTDFIVLDQPTRGLDVGSIEYIQKQIIQKRDSGVACLLISSDLDELLAISDRILVLCRGSLTASLDPSQTTREEIGEYMLGVKEGEASI